LKLSKIALPGDVTDSQVPASSSAFNPVMAICGVRLRCKIQVVPLALVSNTIKLAAASCLTRQILCCTAS
jgi:hypothetical protein